MTKTFSRSSSHSSYSRFISLSEKTSTLKLVLPIQPRYYLIINPFFFLDQT
jgi:hypothetical protein